MRFKAMSLAVTLALSTLAVLSTTASGAAAAEGERVDREIVLAEFGYTNGVSASFTIDEQSRDYGFQQAGEVGRNGPVIDDAQERSYLEAYLAITPRTVEVPQLIVDSHPTGVPLPAELAFRKITTGAVRATGLTAPTSASNAVPCNYQHYNWVQWYDPAGGFHPSKSYKTQTFGAKKEFADSLVVNCGDSNIRHRVYYWSTWHFAYVKHWDSVVTPFHWQAKEKGSVLRDRLVHYDAGSDYTRAGRFHN